MRLSLRGQNLSIELGGFTPLRGASHFLLLVQKKVTKEIHTPDAAPSGCPRLLGQAGRSLNSPLTGLRQRDRTTPASPARLGGVAGALKIKGKIKGKVKFNSNNSNNNSNNNNNNNNGNN